MGSQVFREAELMLEAQQIAMDARPDRAFYLLRLREMILGGELPGGARIAELTVVEKLGFSRTPIWVALMRLEPSPRADHQ